MGGLIGTRLSSSGHDVVLYDTWKQHVETINRQGVTIHGLDDTMVRYRVAAVTEPPSIADADLLLVEVKSYDTRDALKPFARQLQPDTFVLTLQNGLGNLENIRAVLPGHERVLVGTTAHGSAILGPGRIRHTGKGPTNIGDPITPPSQRFNLKPIRDALTGAGFETTIVDNIHSAVWAKLVANVAINPTTALTGLRNGELLDDPALGALIAQAVSETVSVMNAAGVPPLIDDFIGHARRVAKDTEIAYSSMLQDIQHGRRTEIDAINGAVARLGEELGVHTPVNRLLTILVRNREKVARREAARAAKSAEGEHA
jgi:2-dehydropantoate 2-reductase